MHQVSLFEIFDIILLFVSAFVVYCKTSYLLRLDGNEIEESQFLRSNYRQQIDFQSIIFRNKENQKH